MNVLRIPLPATGFSEPDSHDEMKTRVKENKIFLDEALGRYRGEFTRRFDWWMNRVATDEATLQEAQDEMHKEMVRLFEKINAEGEKSPRKRKPKLKEERRMKAARLGIKLYVPPDDAEISIPSSATLPA